MDEIDKCIFEVNAMLGVPEPVAPQSDDVPPSPNLEILSVNKINLDPTKELKRLFGPAPGENRR